MKMLRGMMSLSLRGWLEQYFLGQTITTTKPYHYFFSLAELAVVDEDCDIFALIKTSNLVVVIAPPDACFRVCSRTGGQTLLLTPTKLEDVVPMLTRLSTVLAPSSLIVAYHMSHLAHHGGSWHRSFAWMSFALKHFAKRHNTAVVVVDHEQTLGKKNSALVGRLFLEHSISNNKPDYLLSFLTTMRSFSNNTLTRPPLRVPSGASGKRKNAVPAASF